MSTGKQRKYAETLLHGEGGLFVHYHPLRLSWLSSQVHERNSQLRGELREKLRGGCRALPSRLRTPQPHQVHAVDIHRSALSLQPLRKIWQHRHIEQHLRT